MTVLTSQLSNWNKYLQFIQLSNFSIDLQTYVNWNLDICSNSISYLPFLSVLWGAIITCYELNDVYSNYCYQGFCRSFSTFSKLKFAKEYIKIYYCIFLHKNNYRQTFKQTKHNKIIIRSVNTPYSLFYNKTECLFPNSSLEKGKNLET